MMCIFGFFVAKAIIYCLFCLNRAIFLELCNQIGFEADYAKSHHGVISEGLSQKGFVK